MCQTVPHNTLQHKDTSIYAHTCTYTYICIPITQAYRQTTHTHTHTHACTHTYIHAHAHTHVRTHTRMYARTHTQGFCRLKVSPTLKKGCDLISTAPCLAPSRDSGSFTSKRLIKSLHSELRQFGITGEDLTICLYSSNTQNLYIFGDMVNNSITFSEIFWYLH